MLFYISNCYSQHYQGQRKLEVDSLIGDVELTNLINYDTSSIRFSDFRGKYLLIDFWGTFCVPCVASMPKLEKWGEDFKDSLQILMIAVESSDRVEGFYARRKQQGFPVKLASAISPELAKSYGIREIPHYVWVDTEGRIKAITGHDQLTHENIEKFVSGQKVAFKQKHDKFIDFDPSSPFLLNGNGNGYGEVDLLSHSVLTRYIEGLQAMSFPQRDTSQKRIYGFNLSIQGLYQLAYNNVPLNRVILKVDNPSKYKYMPNDNFDLWKLENAYCYELIVPAKISGDILKIMQQDLNRLFGVKAQFMEEEIECLVLTVSSDTKLRTQGGNPERKIDAAGFTLRNKNINDVKEIIGHFMQNHIILDETNFTDRIDISVNAALYDFDEVQSALKKYGIGLVKAMRVVEVLVLSESI